MFKYHHVLEYKKVSAETSAANTDRRDLWLETLTALLQRAYTRMRHVYTTTTVNNFVDFGFVIPYHKILKYTFTYPCPP